MNLIIVNGENGSSNESLEKYLDNFSINLLDDSNNKKSCYLALDSDEFNKVIENETNISISDLVRNADNADLGLKHNVLILNTNAGKSKRIYYSEDKNGGTNDGALSEKDINCGNDCNDNIPAADNKRDLINKQRTLSVLGHIFKGVFDAYSYISVLINKNSTVLDSEDIRAISKSMKALSQKSNELLRKVMQYPEGKKNIGEYREALNNLMEQIDIEIKFWKGLSNKPSN